MADTPSGSKDIPVSVFTGYLGAGKTTIILSLLKQLPKDYKVVLLKNEFGDVEVDSELAKESSIQAVSEILSRAISLRVPLTSSSLVGQMRSALLEIKENFAPDRIIIESSGSAFPATLAWQVRQLEDEGLKLDSVITVIDCVNFQGYEDNSPTAKMQAKYTDLLLLNKHELVSERQLDTVLDSLYELNTETPKIKISREAPPKPSLVFGLLSSSGAESKVFNMLNDENEDRKRLGFLNGENGADSSAHADAENGEVETVNIWRGGKKPGHEHSHDHQDEHAQSKADNVASVVTQGLTREDLEQLLTKLPSEDIWRVKGFIKLAAKAAEAESPSYYILNWAFGRYELHPASERMTSQLREQGVDIRFTIMGARGEAKRRSRTLAQKLGAELA